MHNVRCRIEDSRSSLCWASRFCSSSCSASGASARATRSFSVTSSTGSHWQSRAHTVRRRRPRAHSAAPPISRIRERACRPRNLNLLPTPACLSCISRALMFIPQDNKWMQVLLRWDISNCRLHISNSRSLPPLLSSWMAAPRKISYYNKTTKQPLVL